MEGIAATPWIVRSLIAWVAILFSAVCTYRARKTPPGVVRFFAALPALLAIHCCPLLFDFRHEPLSAMSATFLCVRLTSGKVIAFILGRGALTLPLTFVQFAAVMLAPFMPAEIAADKVADSTPSGGLQRESTPTADANFAAAQLADFIPKGLHPLHTVWLRVSPIQRFSIDSSPGGTTPSSTSPASSSSSPLDSPRIPAVHQTHDLTADSSTPAQQQQQQGGGGGGSAAPHRLSKAAHAKQSPSLDVCSNDSSRHSGHEWQLAAANMVLNAAVCVAFVAYCCHSTAALRAVCIHLSALAVMWRAMELLMLSVSHPARSWLGLTLAPHFINPFASTSLTDFWARRWNITQGLVLRFYVYEPIIQGRLIATQAAHQQHPQVTSSQTDSSTAERRGDLQPQQPRSGNTPVSGAAAKPPTGRDSLQGSLKRRKPSPFAGPATDSMTTITSSSSSSGATAIPATATLAGPSAAVAPRWRRQLAAAATFVVSGLEHELFLWYLLRHWGYQWFLFFTLQGLLLAVEGKCKRAARAAGLQLRPFVSHLAVLLVLGVTGDVLFWPPLLQPGLVQPLLQAVPPQIATWLGWGVGSYVGST